MNRRHVASTIQCAEDAEMAFKDKFVAFIDVLGFKAMIEAAERSEGRSLEEIADLLA